VYIHAEVRQALDHGQAVVALESTVICHGGAYPENLDVAREMEEATRAEGAVPATIAVLAGEPVIGLQAEQLNYLAQLGPAVHKCSRRDLPIVLAQALDGATTVSGTMVLAHKTGIRVFATGGIGGVHRGHPFDVSADLQELATTPMVIVCSGAKALLDLQATREQLETLGVPVLGYGTDQFPAFYWRDSGLPVDAKVDSPEEVVAMAQARDGLGLQAALLVVVPVPTADELPREQAELAIAEAVRLADRRGTHGSALTPFLLATIAELTQGGSVLANRSLLVNNACVAGRIALALAAQPRRGLPRRSG
jgi:pseudouridine-5'-phosphate glycosidase